ncbi:hypothetical protein ACH9L7_11220 [Haloferax sp. S1W]|uniref:hypothetical protein n=1 Tax=Haloferax sp. S1W TaxID=3377110 RepID=UPI0037CC8663
MAKPRFTNRRTVLKTVGAGIVGSMAAVGTTAAGGHTFARQLNTVRKSTRKYRDVDVAKADGYGFFGIVPHAGIVYENLSDYLVDFDDAGDLQHTDPPALLFYAPSEDVEDQDDVDDSNIILAGVEWLVSGRHEQAPANIFDDENSARALKVTEEEGWHPAPDPNLNFTGLHAWVHMANPKGVFTRDHPIMIERLTD